AELVVAVEALRQPKATPDATRSAVDRVSELAVEVSAPGNKPLEQLKPKLAVFLKLFEQSEAALHRQMELRHALETTLTPLSRSDALHRSRRDRSTRSRRRSRTCRAPPRS